MVVSQHSQATLKISQTILRILLQEICYQINSKVINLKLNSSKIKVAFNM